MPISSSRRVCRRDPERVRPIQKGLNMKGIEAVERYLKTEAGALVRHPVAGAAPVRPVITISRQAGAGGHKVAAALLETFASDADQELFGGWQTFDRELCELVAADPKFAHHLEALLAEQYETKPADFFRQIIGASVDRDLLAYEVFRVVRSVATIGKCIIVGRAGSQLTRDLGLVVSVRIVAPEPDRIAGVMAYYGLEEREARQRAPALDEARARLLRKHFQLDIDDPRLYDVVWNTGQVPIPTIAESIALLMRRKVEAAQLAGAV